MESKCKPEDAKDPNRILEFIKMKNEASYGDFGPGLERSSSLNSLLNHNLDVDMEKSPDDRHSKPVMECSMDALLCDSPPWIMEGLPKNAAKQTEITFEADVGDDHKLMCTTFTIMDKQLSDQAEYINLTPKKCNPSFGSDKVLDSPITSLAKKFACCHLTTTDSEAVSKETSKGGSQATAAADDYNDFGNNKDSLNANGINVAIVDSPITFLTKMMVRCKLTEASIELVPEGNKDVNEFPEKNTYESELTSAYIKQLPEVDIDMTELSEAYIEQLPEEDKDLTELPEAYIEDVPEENKDVNKLPDAYPEKTTYDNELPSAYIEQLPEDVTNLLEAYIEHVLEENKDVNQLPEAYNEQLPEKDEDLTKILKEYFEYLSENNEDELSANIELVPEENEPSEHISGEFNDVNELTRLVPEQKKDMNVLLETYTKYISEENEAANYYTNENGGQDDKLNGSIDEATIVNANTSDRSFSFLWTIPEEEDENLNGSIDEATVVNANTSDRSFSFLLSSPEEEDNKLNGSIDESTMVNANTSDRSFSFLLSSPEEEDNKLNGSIDEATMVNANTSDRNFSSRLSMPAMDNEIDKDFIDATTGLEHMDNDYTKDFLKNIVDSSLNPKVDLGVANTPRKSKKSTSLRVKFNDSLTSIFEYPSEESLRDDNEDTNFLNIGL